MKATENTSDSRPGGFFAGLCHRRVLPISGAYIAIAWLVTEIVGFLLEQGGGSVMSYYRCAMQLRHDGKRVDAERLLKRATSLSPMNVQVHSELVTLFSLQGRDTDAQDELYEIARIQLNRSTSH